MKIKSILDVITNSSSEVFVFKLGDPLYEKAKEVTEFEEYHDLDSVKDLVFSCNFKGIPGIDVRDVFHDDYDYEEMTDENWEKYKEFYEPIIGHAILEIDRDSEECDAIRDILWQDEVEKVYVPVANGLKEGTKYKVTIKLCDDIEEEIEFTWKGDWKNVKFVGKRDWVFTESIIPVLSWANLDTLKEDEN